MNSIAQNNSAVGSSAYWGEKSDWLIAATITRDSDCLGESNWAVFQKALNALPAVKDWPEDESPVQIERFSHWACGWIDYLIINPACKEAVALANELREQLDGYHMSLTKATGLNVNQRRQTVSGRIALT